VSKPKAYIPFKFSSSS